MTDRLLAGKRVLITRASHQARELADKIALLGGEAVCLPVIRLRMPEDPAVLRVIDQAFARLAGYHWIVFTSVNGVDFFFRHMERLKLKKGLLRSARIVAVGPKTAQALAARGLEVHVMPERYRAEELFGVLAPLLKPGERVLLPRVNIARKWLAGRLKMAGVELEDVPIYENVPDGGDGLPQFMGLLRAGEIDFLTFTSPSTVRGLFELVRREGGEPPVLLKGLPAVCIGPATAATARELGLRPVYQAACYTIEHLLDAIQHAASCGASGEEGTLA